MDATGETRGDRFARVAAGAVLFVPAVAFSFSFPEHFRFPKMMAGEGLVFLGALATAAAKWRWGGRPARWTDFAWDLTVAAAVVSLYMGATHRLTGWQDIARLAAYSSAFALFRQLENPWKLLPLVVLAAAVNAGLALLQAGGLGLWESSREGRHAIYGTFGNPNLLAEYLAPAVVLCLAGWYGSQRRVAVGKLVVGGMLVLMIALTGSRAAVLGVCAGVLVLEFRRRFTRARSTAILALLGVVLAGTLSLRAGGGLPGLTPNPTLSTRGLMWTVAVREWRQSPWWGAGPGSYGSGFLRSAAAAMGERKPDSVYAGVTREAHHDGLQLLAERGLLGAGMLLLAAGLAWRGIPTYGNAIFGMAIVTAVGVESCFGFPLRVMATGLVVAWAVACTSHSVEQTRGPAASDLPIPALAAAIRTLAVAVAGLLLLGRCVLAEAALGRGNETALRAGLRALPDHGELHFRLGLGLVGAGRLPEAEAEFIAAQPGFPDPDVLFNLGWIALQQKNDALAADRFKEGLRLYPYFKAPAWADYALALRGLGRRDEAIAAAQRALEIDPGLGRARVLLGELQSRNRGR